MRKVMVDFDDEVQNLRDVRTGQYVELTSIVGSTIVGVKRAENDQLVLVLEGGEEDEEDYEEEGVEPLDFDAFDDRGQT